MLGNQICISTTDLAMEGSSNDLLSALACLGLILDIHTVSPDSRLVVVGICQGGIHTVSLEVVTL